MITGGKNDGDRDKNTNGTNAGDRDKNTYEKAFCFFHFNPVPIICINLWKKNQITKIEASQL